MTKIPDQTSIARKTVHIAPDIASYDARAAGTGIAAIGVSLGELERAETEHQVAKAAADFQIAKSEQDHAYDQDEDYATIEERYSGAMNEVLGSSASGISNPRARTAFVNRFKPVVAAGEERIAKVAWGTEVDSELAEMTERTDALMNAAWKGGDEDMVNANATAMAMYKAAEDKGYINDQKRVEMMKGFKTDLAVGRLETMDPEDRVQALNQPWAQNLPENVRGKLMREATAAQREIRAVGHVDRLMDMRRAGVSESDIQKELRRLPAKYRKEVESRIVYAMNLEDKLETETQTDYLTKYQASAAEGELDGVVLKDLPEWDDMQPDTRMAIIRARNSRASGTKVVTTAETYDEILELYGKGKAGDKSAWADLRKAVNKASAEGRISPADVEQYTKISWDGKVPDEVEYDLKDKEYIQTKVPGGKSVDVAKRRVLFGYLADWKRRHRAANNDREPSEEERDKAVDRGLIEFDTARWRPWGMKSVYKLSPEEREIYDQAMDYIQEKGWPETQENIERAYEAVTKVLR